MKNVNLVPLVIHYSFYPDTPVWLFNTREEAIAELKRQFDEEVRIETEKNGHVIGEDMEIDFYEEDGTWASITIYCDEEDVTEWSIGNVMN